MTTETGVAVTERGVKVGVSVTEIGVQIVVKILGGPRKTISFTPQHEDWNELKSRADEFKSVKEIQGMELIQIDVSETEAQFSYRRVS